MKLRRFCALLVLLVSLGALPAAARPIVLKLGSPTPKGSPWDNALKELAAEWRDITNGQVQMRIFSGGIAGEEADVIRKMRFNSLQGAVLTGLGINMIYPDSFVLSTPFLLHSDDEFEYVLDKIEGRLKADIERKGFKVISWASVGWIYFFSTEKVVTPDDMRKLKLATSDTDVAIAQTLKALNFNAIPVGLNELLTSLNSGMIDACYTVRVGAAAYQWFGIANHMTDLPLAPVLAGIVVSNRAWNQVPDQYKDEMVRAAERVARNLSSETEQLEQDAMEIMLDNGLIVHDVPGAVVEEWRSDFERGIDMIKGDAFSEDIYEAVKQHLEEYRSRYGTN